jgi:hypothetical protein
MGRRTRARSSARGPDGGSGGSRVSRQVTRRHGYRVRASPPGLEPTGEFDMRHFFSATVLASALVVSLLGVQTLVIGVVTCGVRPVVSALAETGHPPSLGVSWRAPAVACTGTDTHAAAPRPAPAPLATHRSCFRGGVATTLGPLNRSRMPNALEVRCPDPRESPRPLRPPHRKPSVGTVGAVLQSGTRRTARS